MDEFFDVFDESGKHIGVFPRRECHGNPALIHRSVHVVVFDSSGKNVLLQKRSALKDIQPGKWDTAVGGHVDAGESVEHAATRELAEELGIKNAVLQPFFTSTIRNDIESENVTVFKISCDGPFDFAPEEIDEVRFWQLDDLRRAEKRCRDDFTPNLQRELEEIIKILDRETAQ